uniref:Globin family profile domain-containing protein n=1 Tax=Panagrolaimus sp. JU765 TaxID=591449 RepID=A0AC34RBV6_9BILA
VSLSSAEDPSVATLLLAVEELRDQVEKSDYSLTIPRKKYPSFSEEEEDEERPMSEGGSTTALAVGMAAAAAAAHAASAPTSPHSILQAMKTVDFTGIDEKEQENFTPRRVVTDVDRRRQSLAQRRQSNVQLVQSVSGRRTSTTLIPLTMAQIHLVRSLWRQIYVSKGPTVIGQAIIHKLFFKLPKTKEQFRKCPIPKNFPNHDSFAKAHSKAMAEMMDNVVEQLDNLEAVAGQLERVGRCHARVMRGELSSKLWNSVAETIIDCTLEWGDKRCRSETVRKAWALIVAFIIERIKTGHLEERKLGVLGPDH